MEIHEIKTDLLCLGARLEESSKPDRAGGAGPSDAFFIKINGVEASVPVANFYASQSPYILKRINGKYLLLRKERVLFSVERLKRPDFYNKVTDDNIPYYKIFLAHGSQCIGTTVFQSCSYWNTTSGCKFCGIGLSLRNGMTIPLKSPEQLRAVAWEATKENFNHAVLTTGSLKKESELFNHLAMCIKALKEVPIQVQVQVSPPEDSGLIGLLKESGARTIAINIESFDEDVLRSIAPRKASIGIKRYLKTMEYAVKLFGENQVISFVLIGLGENKRSIIDGAGKLISMGVYPFILPFRPIPGTPLLNTSPPSPSYVKEVNSKVAKILKRYNMSHKKIVAGCGRCTCCSSLPEHES